MSFHYLSPTTFIKYHKQCQWRTYLEKVKEVLPKEMYNDGQTMAMATGSAFDIMVKGALNRRINVAEELKKSILEKNAAAVQLAEVIFSNYSKGPLIELKKEGTGYTGVEQEGSIEWTDPAGKAWESIMFGMPDLVTTGGQVYDWKCQGMFGRGKRPKDGYVRCYVYGTGHPFHGKDMGSSGKCDAPLESIENDWAIQTYLYSRLLGGVAGNPKLTAGIENICVDADDTIYCASYRNPISVEFQLKIESSYHSAYSKLKKLADLVRDTNLMEQHGRPLDEVAIETLERPHCSKLRCISYGKLCPVADFCFAHQEFIREGGRF